MAKMMIVAAGILCSNLLVAGAQTFEQQIVQTGKNTSAAAIQMSAKQAVPSQEMLDRLMKADDEIIRVQTLLGQYVVGSTISGPVLRTGQAEVMFGADFKDVLGLFPFLPQTLVDGRIKVRLGNDVASEYGRIRAEFMARLPRLVLLERISGLENRDLSRGHLIWARSLRIVSQPECVDLVGRNPWPDFCS